jgi:multidrug efflux pump subunit AcrB
MGPYMRPIPVGASAAMVFSLIVAFVVSPWAALRLLRHYAGGAGHGHHEAEGWTTRFYRKVMNPLILDARRRWMFLAGVVVLLMAAVAFVPLKWVRVKVLPFDNKSEFQVMIDIPDGTPLEQTTRVAQTLGHYLEQQPEVINYQIYAGTSGPYNFNGLVRHYFLRRQPNQADIQVNLLSRHDRKAQSHEIARRLRPELVKLAAPFGARIKVAEVPPWPPVLETLVAEVYGPNYQGQIQLASQIKQVFQKTPGVVDVDWYVEDPQTKYDLKVDLDKASLHGISAADVTRTLQVGLSGGDAGLLHDPASREDIPIRVRLSRADRSSIQDLANLKLPTPAGGQIALQELTDLNQTTIDNSVYRKNLQPVVYVTGDVAGEEESPVYAIGKMSDAIDKIRLPDGYAVKQYKGTTMPERTDHYSMKWDGEWHITVEVFRDLGLAFAAVLVLIYVLVVGWFKSFKTPLVIMAPIPLTLVGILPAHTLMGAFFTATSMIGFIAGAGIIVRNSNHPGRFHPTAPFAGNGAGRCGRGCGRSTVSPHAAYGRCCGGGRQRDSLRSDLSGPRPITHGWRSRFHGSLAHGSACALLHERARKQQDTRHRISIAGGTRMTVERGLRLMAGTFILVSLALGYWISPYWYLFTAFVGLNLFQSGLTNWCPAMFILKKLGLRSA